MCVQLIVTVARAVQSLVVTGIHSAFSMVTFVCYCINTVYSINRYGHFRYSLKLSFAVLVFLIIFIVSNFLSLALKVIQNTSSSLKISHRFDFDMPPGVAIVVCIYECNQMRKGVNANKRVMKRSLIGSLIGPLADLFGFHSSYEIERRQRKYRLRNAREIRKCFENWQTTNSKGTT